MALYLQIENASKNYGDINLFSGLSLTINEGDKVALVARNGAGKTTLMNILAGRDTFDSGAIYLNKDIKTGYLPQDPRFEAGHTVFQTIYGAPGKLMEVVRNYELALHQKHHEQLSEASAQMDFHQAWDLESRIRQMLGVLKPGDEDQLVETLSGGQLKRLALAVALLNDPHFLLLDEPTNHLDLDMVEWLEEYLTKTRITLLMVTHDRYFLDRVCNEIVEIDEGEVFNYHGNYSQFIQKREERIMNRAMQVERAQNLLRGELEWMRRMPKARTTKAKYRIDAFYDLQKQSSYKRNERQIDVTVQSSRLGKKILKMEKVSKRFEEQVMLDEFSYTFNRGEKLGIIGPNGTGKTTFLNILTGQLHPDQGVLDYGETVVFGYYKQAGPEFKPGQRVIDVIREIAEFITLADGRQLSASQFLNQFLFSPEMQYVQVDKLSGGEKRRLYLMTVLIRNPNFIILDEPTNDFDIMTLNVLEKYLLEFNGCLVIVSHDRFFMDKLVDHLFIFEGDGVVYDFPGNYTEYRASVKKQESDIRRHETQLKAAPETEKVKPKDVRTGNKLTFKEKREFEQLSAEIALLEQEKSNIEATMDSNVSNADELVSLSVRMAEIIKLIDEKSDRWLELSDRS